MAIKYSCFISYRHGQHQLVERIIADLSVALSNELEVWTDKEVFVDRERLKGGAFYKEDLARAICESVCMIMVFTPRYFDKESPFCAREFRAMESLEEERMKAIGALPGERTPFIIPIIFRGKDFLPQEIRENRHYYDFSDFLLCDVEISRHPQYAPKIREIAETIYKQYLIISQLPEDPCKGCATFSLPKESAVAAWLVQIQSFSPPYPGR